MASLIEALAEYGRALARQAHEAGVPVLRPTRDAGRQPAQGPLMGYPAIRPRRLRATPALRRLVAETRACTRLI